MNVLDQHLADFDPEVAELIGKELQRQRNGLEMIASENHAPLAVMQAQGSVLTNKYAEGYPGRRYYGGCEHVDVIEQLAIDRVKALFDAEFANVQPHSGAQANAAVMHALLKPGDTILGLSLDCGGHLTHGMRLNFSGKLYNVAAYGVPRDDYLIDMDQVAEAAREHRPKLIIAGWSAYPRHLDFARFREIADEVGAYLMVDMAHFAGLVAAGLHPSPVPHAHVDHVHHPQDPRRAARRHHPDQRRGHRQEDQLGGLPRSAGRAARARHRGQGRRLQDGRPARVRRAPAALHRRREDPRRAAVPAGCPRRGHHCAHRRYRRAPGAGGPAQLRTSTASRPRTGWPRSASPSTATPFRSIRAHRW